MAEVATASSIVGPFQTEAEKNNEIVEATTGIVIQSPESCSASIAVEQLNGTLSDEQLVAAADDSKKFVTQPPMLSTASNTTSTEKNNSITAAAADAGKVIAQSEASSVAHFLSSQTSADMSDVYVSAVATSKNIIIRSPTASASTKTTNAPADATNRLNANKPTIGVPSIPSTMPALTECNQCSSGLNMSVLLPLQKCYPTRGSAVEAAKLAVVRACGKGIKVDDARSGSKKVVLRCSSVMKKVSGSSAKWVGDLFDEFECEKRDGESIWSYRRRRANELELYVSQKKGMCSFKAEARKKKCKDDQRKHFWKFIVQKNGSNYIGHDKDCQSTAKITGRILRSLIRSAVQADPRQKNRSLLAKLKKEGVTEAMLPSKSSTYRAQKAIRIEFDAWYDDPESKARRGRPKMKRPREDTNPKTTTEEAPLAQKVYDTSLKATINNIATKNFNMLSKAYAQVTRASVKVQACADANASDEGIAKRARPEDKTARIQISDDDDADNNEVDVAFEAPKAVVLQI